MTRSKLLESIFFLLLESEATTDKVKIDDPLLKLVVILFLNVTEIT